MNKVKLVFALGAIFGLSSSCEKEIDINLPQTDPVIVIEGVVTSRADSQVVKITRSGLLAYTGYYPVSGAEVSITEDGVGKATLNETKPGIYIVRNRRGRSGHTYFLKVEVDGKVYTATSTMPNEVRIDKLSPKLINPYGKTQQTVSVEYQDPMGVRNYYRCRLWINDNLFNVNFMFNDSFRDGKKNSDDIVHSYVNLASNDFVIAELQSVDSAVYRYWLGLDLNVDQGQATTTPGNPVSNISNGALGYFSAHGTFNMRVKVP